MLGRGVHGSQGCIHITCNSLNQIVNDKFQTTPCARHSGNSPTCDVKLTVLTGWWWQMNLLTQDYDTCRTTCLTQSSHHVLSLKKVQYDKFVGLNKLVLFKSLLALITYDPLCQREVSLCTIRKCCFCSPNCHVTPDRIFLIQPDLVAGSCK